MGETKPDIKKYKFNVGAYNYSIQGTSLRECLVEMGYAPETEVTNLEIYELTELAPSSHNKTEDSVYSIFDDLKDTKKQEHEQEHSVETILAKRGLRYGAFNTHSAITQHLLSVCMCSDTQWEILTASQKEAIHMICHKLGRILNVGGDANYKDSWDDIAGYATLVAKECV